MCESPRHGRVGLHWLARRRPLARHAATNRVSSISSLGGISLMGRHRRRATSSMPSRCARRCAGATPSCTSPPSPTSARSRSTRCAPTSSTRAAPASCSRPSASKAFGISSTAAPSGSTRTLRVRKRSTRTHCSCRPNISIRRRSWPERCTAVVRGDVRPRADHPALRHPAWAWRSRSDGRRALRRTRSRGPAAQHHRRRQPGSPVRVRGGPCRGHRGLPDRGGAGPHVQPGRRRDGERARDRSHRRRPDRRRFHRARSRPADGSRSDPDLGAARVGGARLARDHAVRGRRRALRPLVAGTNGSPIASTAATIAGSAPTVLRHESGAL